MIKLMAAKKTRKKQSGKKAGRPKANKFAVASTHEVVVLAIEEIAKSRREFTEDEVFSWLRLYAAQFSLPTKAELAAALKASKTNSVCRRITKKVKTGAETSTVRIWESLVFLRDSPGLN